MPTIYSKVDRERAEIFAMREILLTILAAFENNRPGVLEAIKNRTGYSLDHPFDQDYLNAKPELVRERVQALVSQAAAIAAR
jgi:hypothetical protein